MYLISFIASLLLLLLLKRLLRLRRPKNAQWPKNQGLTSPRIGSRHRQVPCWKTLNLTSRSSMTTRLSLSGRGGQHVRSQLSSRLERFPGSDDLDGGRVEVRVKRQVSRQKHWRSLSVVELLEVVSSTLHGLLNHLDRLGVSSHGGDGRRALLTCQSHRDPWLLLVLLHRHRYRPLELLRHARRHLGLHLNLSDIVLSISLLLVLRLLLLLNRYLLYLLLRSDLLGHLLSVVLLLALLLALLLLLLLLACCLLLTLRLLLILLLELLLLLDILLLLHLDTVYHHLTWQFLFFLSLVVIL